MGYWEVLGGTTTAMLLPEAIIAEILGALFIAYSCTRRIRGGEGYGAAVLVIAVVLLAVIPVTAKFLS
ncbi:MAG TPA: hypothetical protein VNL35_14635 [Chloroflexota bacterium]|nr:hypothetical protein [Chloroflexota bacterium]